MIFGHDYYHATIRRYVIMFGNIFNEMTCDRYNSDGTLNQKLNVPISYGPKQKTIERVLADPSLEREVSVVLPRLSFNMNSMGYNPIRKLNSMTLFRNNYDTQTKTFAKAYSPVPYDFQFTLSILVKNIEDGTQLVEKIVPFFTPDYTVSMKVLPELGTIMDIPIELGNVSYDDSYEGDFNSQRVLSWDLDFTVKGYLFGPVTSSNYIAVTETPTEVDNT